jgi:hypothetical protein
MTSQILERPFSPTDQYTPGPDAQVLFFYRKLGSLDAADLDDQLLRAIRYELDLPGLAQRRRTLDRLRAWLALPRDEARRVAAAFERATAALLPLERQDLQEIEQDAILNGLSFEEFQRLRDIAPWLKALTPLPAGEQAPPRVPPLVTAALAMAGD